MNTSLSLYYIDKAVRTVNSLAIDNRVSAGLNMAKSIIESCSSITCVTVRYELSITEWLEAQGIKRNQRLGTPNKPAFISFGFNNTDHRLWYRLNNAKLTSCSLITSNELKKILMHIVTNTTTVI